MIKVNEISGNVCFCSCFDDQAQETAVSADVADAERSVFDTKFPSKRRKCGVIYFIN